MSNDYFRKMIKNMPNTNIADDELHSAEFSGTIDTGSYILNAVFSGSIFGGVPDNKVTGFAGGSTTGKTFFVLGLARRFLEDNENSGIFYFDTESAVTKQMLLDHNIDPSRFIISEPSTIQDFRTSFVKILDEYKDTPVNERPRFMAILDSLGQLSTNKEIADITDGNDTRDMTRAQLVRGTFRAIQLKVAKAKVPLLVTNHTYAGIGQYASPNEISGGGGFKYSASQIALLTKKKDKEGDEVVGNIINCKMYKSRFTKENKSVDVKLSYNTGLDRYYGLLDLAEKHGIFKKVSTRYELPDGSKVFGKSINENPEKYFTKDILTELDKAAGIEFKYGNGEFEPVEDEEDVTEQ